MYSGSSTGTSLRSYDSPVSFVSHDECSLGDQQWFSSAGHIQGVNSSRDKNNMRRSFYKEPIGENIQ
ncbi:hypothetical protein MTR67_026625 [Solanum verrucosum]|uniref:Uncharacterized protein n=1 Tax=Solanum verrucosum TaxID=315347 RepID=A0AAF0R5W2_SOLVR|nr:hypothetical protein MTR67_026625 [Solanum verrucosum]